MKATHLCFAMAFAAPALAQTLPGIGLTVYGRLDTSVNRIRYGGTPTADAQTRSFVSSDSSHLGFRGAEDLGSGTRAYFKLEHWFSADTGTAFNPNQFFNREAYVGLGRPDLGYVQLGSQYAPGVWLSLKTDPFARSNQGALFTLFQTTPGNARGFSSTANNTIQYASPRFAGLAARAMFAAPEGTDLNRSVHLGVDFTSERTFAALSVDRTRLSGTVAGRPATAQLNQTVMSLGTTHQFDHIKLHAYGMRGTAQALPTIQGYMAGATMALGAGELRMSWSQLRTPSSMDADASLAALGYFHFLSRRTTVYGVVSRLENQGKARFGLWPSSVDAGGATWPRAGETQTGVQVGIRHTF